MKGTLKNYSDYNRNASFVVVSFKKGGARERFYGKCKPLQALAEMSYQSKRGLRVLLLPGDFNLRAFEISQLNGENSQSDGSCYEKMLPFAVSSESFYH